MNRKHLIHGASPKAARTPHHQPQERQWSGIPIAKPKLARRDHRTQTLNEAKKKKTVCCRSLIKTFAQFSCLPSVSLARQDTKEKKAINHTHMTEVDRKKKPRRLFSKTEQRGREAANLFSSLHRRPPSFLLSPSLPTATPSRKPTPLSSPPTTQSRRTAKPNTSQHPNAKNQASHEKKEEGVVSIYSFREKTTENRKRRKRSERYRRAKNNKGWIYIQQQQKQQTTTPTPSRGGSNQTDNAKQPPPSSVPFSRSVPLPPFHPSPSSGIHRERNLLSPKINKYGRRISFVNIRISLRFFFFFRSRAGRLFRRFVDRTARVPRTPLPPPHPKY